jgi:3-methyl-2-oxobutanoate hydroxymethyltransferase
MQSDQTRVRIPQILAMKQRGEKITMLTAYDATMARLMDRAGVDVLLVGDSLGTVIMGYDTTLPVTLDAVIHHTRAVTNGARRALVVADMPFLTYQVEVSEAVRNAGRLLQEGGAAAVKLEGGVAVADTMRRLVSLGIPVMGHVGLTPQSVHQLGGFRAVGKTPSEADRVMEDARAVQQAGAFAVVLESMPAGVAEAITRELTIPTIGIGAGPSCDGQVLVSYDAFGLFDAFLPRFVKQYARLGDEMVAATKEYVADVREGRFPAREHSIQGKETGVRSQESE